ncbi:hypothetical protein AB9M62_06170 [Bacillales bacterium AN1005]
MKRVRLLVMLLLSAVMMSSCGKTTMTTSAIISVVANDSSDSDYWIDVQNIDDPGQETTKLHISDENTWNLIEINQHYTVTYMRDKGSTDGDLSTIKKSESE